MANITKEMNIGEIVKKYPDTAMAFGEAGLGCVGCVASHFETLEEGMKAHGMDDKQIEELVEKLNKIAQSDD